MRLCFDCEYGALLTAHGAPWPLLLRQPEIVSNGVQIQTANGKQGVTNADYIHYIRREKPAAVIALADEVGPHCGRNRREKSVKRTIDWLKELCEQKEALGCRIYGVCVGGSQIPMRQRCAEAMKNLPLDGEHLTTRYLQACA